MGMMFINNFLYSLARNYGYLSNGMKKYKRLIIGNWKMNPLTVEEAKRIASQVKRSTRLLRKTQVVICPPFVYISPLGNITSKNIFLGAQDAFYESTGHFTGEVSFRELPQFKVSFVIIGHSERRKMGESDEVINKKVKAVVGEGMTAIICIGESLRDRDGSYFNFIRHQVLSSLKDVSRKWLDRIVIAYEPIWAVGAREAIGPRELHEMSIFIKKVLKDFYGIYADGVRVIYGGDADRVNSDRLVSEGNVSGLLIGRESLKAKDFIEIIKLVDAI